MIWKRLLIHELCRVWVPSSVWVSPRIRVGVPEKGPRSFRSGWSPDVGTRETVDLILNTLHFLKCFFCFFFIFYLFKKKNLLLIYYLILLHDEWDIEWKYSFLECKYTVTLHGSTTDLTAVVSARLYIFTLLVFCLVLQTRQNTSDL